MYEVSVNVGREGVHVLEGKSSAKTSPLTSNLWKPLPSKHPGAAAEPWSLPGISQCGLSGEGFLKFPEPSFGSLF